MKRLACGAAALAAVLSLAFLSAGTAGADDESLTVKQIMAKLHKGAKAPLGQLKKDLNASSPDWAKIKAEGKDLATYGAALAKTEPPRGDKASYDRLTKDYADQAKALSDAAEQEDLAAAKAAHAKLSASCKACHSAHKGK